MSDIKISVIVPSYNQGKYISNVIESTLGQTYQNWELIIQDGASTDITSEVCEKYAREDSRISFTSEKDKGFADAVNKGLKKATGTLVIIQSSDDFFACEDVFQDAVNIYNQNNKLIIIAGASVIVDESLQQLAVQERVSKYVPAQNLYSLKDHFSQGATFFTLERAREINGLDSNVDMVADTDFWIRMACYSPAAFNTIFQTSKVYGAVLIQPDQRSADLAKFYFGRAKMAVEHVNNKSIAYNSAFKISHANSLIQVGIDHFNSLGKSIGEFKELFKKLNGKDYTEIRSTKKEIKGFLKKLLKRNLINPSNNSKSEIYGNQSLHSLQNINWFS